MRISFDYDETLSKTRYQRLARAFVDAGVEVYIITNRAEEGNNNKDIEAIAHFIGVDTQRIHYTEGAYKAELIKLLNIDMHYDDMDDEIHVIRILTKCIGVKIDLC